MSLDSSRSHGKSLSQGCALTSSGPLTPILLAGFLYINYGALSTFTAGGAELSWAYSVDKISGFNAPTARDLLPSYSRLFSQYLVPYLFALPPAVGPVSKHKLE